MRVVLKIATRLVAEAAFAKTDRESPYDESPKARW